MRGVQGIASDTTQSEGKNEVFRERVIRARK